MRDRPGKEQGLKEAVQREAQKVLGLSFNVSTKEIKKDPTQDIHLNVDPERKTRTAPLGSHEIKSNSFIKTNRELS